MEMVVVLVWKMHMVFMYKPTPCNITPPCRTRTSAAAAKRTVTNIRPRKQRTRLCVTRVLHHHQRYGGGVMC